MSEERKEILDYLKKEVDKFEESKTYLMETYNYREQDIENIEQHKKYVYFKKLLDYITNLQQKVEQLENIRKEAIKYVQEKADYPISYYHCLNDLLNILNKGSDKE